MKRLLYISLIGLAVAATGCRQESSESTSEEVAIGAKIMVVGTDTNSYSRTYVGTIEAETSLPLRFALGGELTALEVKAGQRVKKGQMIAEVNATQKRNAYRAAEATLHQAEDALKRLEKVHAEGAIAEVKWVEVQTQVEKARATADALRKELDDCTLKAPQDGVVGECEVHIGENLLPGQTVCTLMNTRNIAVAFTLPENEIDKVQIGQEASVVIPALNDTCLRGEISEKAMSANPLAHTYTVKMRIANSGERLRPGMVGKVMLTENGKSGIVVPANCLQTRPKGQSVWVVVNGCAEQRGVEVGEFVKNGVMIRSGLETGDSVVVEGYQKMFVGAKVIDN